MRWPLALVAAGAWAAAAPYLADAAGLRLELAARLEVVDHVVPGVVVLLAAALVTGSAVPGDARWSVAAGLTTLAGLWITATHVPLLAEASDGISPWDAAVVHLSAGPPVVLAGAAMLVRPLRSAR